MKIEDGKKELLQDVWSLVMILAHFYCVVAFLLSVILDKGIEKIVAWGIFLIYTAIKTERIKDDYAK